MAMSQINAGRVWTCSRATLLSCIQGTAPNPLMPILVMRPGQAGIHGVVYPGCAGADSKARRPLTSGAPFFWRSRPTESEPVRAWPGGRSDGTSWAASRPESFRLHLDCANMKP